METRAEIEEAAEKLQAHCKEVCKKKIRRMKITVETENGWWTQGLERDRRRVRRLRREMQEERDENKRRAKATEYRRIRNDYKK